MDYKELISLAALLVAMTVEVTIWKPGAMHRARWMAKAIYSLKLELLLDCNETAIKLPARKLQAVQRFNRVCCPGEHSDMVHKQFLSMLQSMKSV